MAAKLRASSALSPFAGVLNFFFDKDFAEPQLESRHTRAVYSYGAPLPGYSTFLPDSSDPTLAAEAVAQKTAFKTWWYEEGMGGLVCSNGAGCSDTWQEVEPISLITVLFWQVGEQRRLHLASFSFFVRPFPPVRNS